MSRHLSVMSLKRKNLTISEKLNVIEFASTHNQRDVADRFGISVGAVNNILKKKQEIQMACEENCNPQMKRVRLFSHCEVNDRIWQWFITTRPKNISISGPILQAKGIDFAEQLGIPFKASNGWLGKFRSRYNIAFKTLCRESASVDPGTVDTWKQQLHTIIGGYSPEKFSIVMKQVSTIRFCQLSLLKRKTNLQRNKDAKG